MDISNIIKNNENLQITPEIFTALQPMAGHLFDKENLKYINGQHFITGNLYIKILEAAYSTPYGTGVNFGDYLNNLPNPEKTLLCDNILFLESLLNTFLKTKFLTDKKALNAELLNDFEGRSEDLDLACSFLKKNNNITSTDSGGREDAIETLVLLIEDLFLYNELQRRPIF